MIKTKKNYSCGCGMNFGNRKDNYNAHINRINPCEALLKLQHQTTPENTPKTPETPETPEIPKKNEQQPLCVIVGENEKKYCCEFCNQNFVRKYCLDRHQNGRCKIKQSVVNKTNKQTENKLLEIDNKVNLILKQNEELRDINEELRDENEKLKKQIKKTKSVRSTKSIKNINSHNKTVNINQPNVNVNVNNNIIVNFNDLRLEDVDEKLFIQPIMNPKLQGKFIILQMIENIYINKTHPEYQNLIITDKNRGYVKIYNNGRWKTNDIHTINLVIDGIISQSKNILYDLKEKYINNVVANNRLNVSEKYINFCDLEYLADLEDEQANGDGNINNTLLIKRCKDFRDMVYKDTISMFHDSKDILTKTKTFNEKIIEL